MSTKVISFFLFLFCITFCFSQDVYPPSFSPPGGRSVNDPENEIRSCDSILEFIGIPKAEVFGFRTLQPAIVPFLLDATGEIKGMPFQRDFLLLHDY